MQRRCSLPGSGSVASLSRGRGCPGSLPCEACSTGGATPGSQSPAQRPGPHPPPGTAAPGAPSSPSALVLRASGGGPCSPSVPGPLCSPAEPWVLPRRWQAAGGRARAPRQRPGSAARRRGAASPDRLVAATWLRPAGHGPGSPATLVPELLRLREVEVGPAASCPPQEKSTRRKKREGSPCPGATSRPATEPSSLAAGR